jgi:asparagine synthase (glutamine-hydrolysing)
MCGIALVFSRRSEHQRLVSSVLAALRHRGPDAEGVASFAVASAPDWVVSIAHTRLAIVGLGDIGAQPKVEADRCGLIFNGEIYGPAAGTSLRKAGLVSDTQWLWETANRGGPEVPSRGADGIWGLVTYDARTERVIVSRDPLGVIPVYGYEWAGGLIICSEIQAIAKAAGPLKINDRALIAAVASRQLSYGRYIEGLTCIGAGENRSYTLRDGVARCIDRSTHDYLVDYQAENSSFGEAFERAVTKQFEADVPLGIQLSGGTDSTLIAATLARGGKHDINAFTARTNASGRDEADFAVENAKALGLKRPVEITIDQAAFSHEVVSSFGRVEPAFSHPNFFAVKRIAKTARERGIKVLLCGEGADELFRGYSRLLPSNVARLFSARAAHFVLKQVDFRRLNFDWSVPSAARQAMIENAAIGYSWVKDPSLRHLFCNYLHELLYRQNIAGMCHSVEVRPPFLDFSVVGYAITHPTAFFSMAGGRFVLKAAVKKELAQAFSGYVGPRRKSGFAMPLYRLFNDDATALLHSAVRFSANELGIDRSAWMQKFRAKDIGNIEFERHLWPALVAAGAVVAAGHSI